MSFDILVINANPLLNVVHPGSFEVGAINRVAGLEIHAEGKGVNVARLLSRLGHRVILTGFAGGHSGAWLRDLIRAEGIEDAFIETRAPVRMGFMASCGSQDHPTTVLANGFVVTTGECAALRARVAGLLPRVKLAILSGSVPDPLADDVYARILTDCRAAGVEGWLDAHGEALTRALAGDCPPALAKPNREEFEQSPDWSRVHELHITDGGGRAEIRIGNRPVWEVTPPAIQQVNPVGSGDCYLAGLAHGWLCDWPLEERLRLAAAAGAANALRQDVAMITPADIEPLRAEVGLRRLD